MGVRRYTCFAYAWRGFDLLYLLMFARVITFVPVNIACVYWVYLHSSVSSWASTRPWA